MKTSKLFTALSTLLPTPTIRRVRESLPDRKTVIQPFDHAVRGDIVIDAGDRWGVFGVTRSGKTTFTIKLLDTLKRQYTQLRIYVYDSKWKGGDFDNWPGIIRSAEAPDSLRAPGGIQVWQPPYNDRFQQDIWLKRILASGQPAVINIDELSSLGGRQGNRYPEGLDWILKQGAGLNIGLIANSQEVARIPRNVLMQMTHLVRFTLNPPGGYDSRILDQLLGRDRSEYGINPKWHSFYYRKVSDGRGRLYLFNDYRELLK